MCERDKLQEQLIVAIGRGDTRIQQYWISNDWSSHRASQARCMCSLHGMMIILQPRCSVIFRLGLGLRCQLTSLSSLIRTGSSVSWCPKLPWLFLINRRCFASAHAYLSAPLTWLLSLVVIDRSSFCPVCILFLELGQAICTFQSGLLTRF